MNVLAGSARVLPLPCPNEPPPDTGTALMPAVTIEPHARQRMALRGVTSEDIAHVWQRFEKDRPSSDSPGFRVRTGRVPDGRVVTVVGRQTPGEFRVKTVWVAS